MALASLRRSMSLMFPHHPINILSFSFLPASPKHASLGARYISLQAIRNRKKSVENIQKITKAMKMVAASKLRQIQPKAENSRGLWQPFTALLGDNPSVNVKKNVIIAVSSDRVLCGAIHSTSVRDKLTSGPEKEATYVILGEKAKVQLVRDLRKNIELNVTELQKNPLNYTQVSVLADDILKDVKFDALRILFNKFNTAISSSPIVLTVLLPQIVERESEAGGKLGNLDFYEIEGAETKSEIL